MNADLERQADVVEVAANLAVEPPDRFESAEATKCLDTRRRSLSASASICDVETLRVLPIVDSRTLIQTVFFARSTPGS